VVLALALVAAGCGATPEEEAGGQSAVKNPGTFVHALEGEPESLDPARAPAGGYGDRAIIQVYEFLVDIPPDKAEPVPMLATQVPTQANKLVSADGLTYTFPLRTGVKFPRRHRFHG
jgi:peptide/nickel transport system substrate-binding protein